MIEIKNVDFFYETAESESSLKNVSVTVPKGQVVLLCGESGSGKTTFGRLINGLIPCYYDGKMDGQVFVNKISTAGIQLHELAETVGSVFRTQNHNFIRFLPTQRSYLPAKISAWKNRRYSVVLKKRCRIFTWKSCSGKMCLSCPAAKNKRLPAPASVCLSHQSLYWMSLPLIWISVRSAN